MKEITEKTIKRYLEISEWNAIDGKWRNKIKMAKNEQELFIPKTIKTLKDKELLWTAITKIAELEQKSLVDTCLMLTGTIPEIQNCEPGTIGRPKFKCGDLVGFSLIPYKEEKAKFFYGRIYIVDAHGTFGQHNEPSYDIMVYNFNNTEEPTLVKHVKESDCCYIAD